MKFLFIGTISPPITGQSMACDLLLSKLQSLQFDVHVINLSKTHLKNNNLEISRFYFFLKIVRFLLFNAHKFDKIYFTVSESTLGNWKDLVLYLAMMRSLGKVYVHVHGGMGFKTILRAPSFRRYLNKMFLSRLAKIIVLGDFHRNTFANIGLHNLAVVKNFSGHSMFNSTSSVGRNIVYLSNMIESKGYLGVLNSVDLVDDVGCTFYFAGAFQLESDRINFEKAISLKDNVQYLGVVSGEKKRDLLENCDIFILPTNYPYEGQPISILEAYASSCAVITCNHSGIPDIFEDGTNGMYVKFNNSTDISSKISSIFADTDRLIDMKNINHSSAREFYTEEIHIDNLLEALDIYDV